MMSYQPSKINLTSTEDGIHLDGSILWLDSQYTGDLSFLSSAYANPGRYDSRVIATQETIKILEVYRKKPQALVCQYNHRFAIGPLGMELLPSGVGLGGASLWIETKKKNILYAPHLQPQKTEVSRQMQIRRSDVLVIGAKKPFTSRTPNYRRKEKELLLDRIGSLIDAGGRPIVICKAFPTAQELTLLFSEAGYHPDVQSTIYRINKVHEELGVKLGQYQQFTSQSRGKVIILPSSRFKWSGKKPIPNGPIVNVFDAFTPPHSDGIFRKPVADFFIPSSCEGSELKDIIGQANPQVLYIFGPYAKDYADQLKTTARYVKPLFPRHLPSLF